MNVKISDGQLSGRRAAPAGRYGALVGVILGAAILIALVTMLQPAVPLADGSAAARDVEAVNPELRQAARYEAPVVVDPRADGAVQVSLAENPEVQAAQRYAREHVRDAEYIYAVTHPGSRLTERYPLLRAGRDAQAVNPEVGVWQRYVAARDAE